MAAAPEQNSATTATGLAELSALPARLARFCLGLRSFAAQELGCDFAATSCLVACSGGADSTALLRIAALLCRKFGGQVFAAHLDHSLRPESAKDALFVADLCRELGVTLYSEQIDIAAQARAQGQGLEEAGRAARYAFLERMRRHCGAEVILLGHQLNDLAEDQLMRLARGAGWPALGGMAGHDPKRHVLRPLLLTPRARLEEFLRNSGCGWRVDESNGDQGQTRNRVRAILLPALERENPAYLDAAARLWRQARVDEAHWQAELAVCFAALPDIPHGGPGLIPQPMLEAAPAPLRLRLYKSVLERLGPGQALADSLLRLDELWRKQCFGKRLRFPGDKEARIGKSGLSFRVIDRKKECG